MATLRHTLAMPGVRVVWLVGPAGSGKSARLWRAQEASLGLLVRGPEPHPVGGETVWLVDEPAEPTTVIGRAARHQTRLVIAARERPARRDGEVCIELGAWRRRETEQFLAQIEAARDRAGTTLAKADFARVADKVAELGGRGTPRELGHLIRLFVDEPALLTSDIAADELRVRTALHEMRCGVELAVERDQRWRTHGRRAYATAAAAAARAAGLPDPLAPIDRAAVCTVLDGVAEVTVGDKDGEPLHAVLARARREAGHRDKGVLETLDTWASGMSGARWLDLLVELGAWRREGEAVAPSDRALALRLAAERLDDAWMWDRLRRTLADPTWAAARFAWAPRLGHVNERLGELLGAEAACHTGAIELAVALVAFAEGNLEPALVERAVCSAVRLHLCVALEPLGLAPNRALRHAMNVASERHVDTLPAVTGWTQEDLEARCTEGMRCMARAAERAASGERATWAPVLRGPAWVAYAVLLPWQALPGLEDPASRRFLASTEIDTEAVILTHAERIPWARAVATGNVEDLQVTAELMSQRGVLHAIERWSPPADRRRHEQVVAWMVFGLTVREADALRWQRAKIVELIVGFLLRYPDYPLPERTYLAANEELWRAAFSQAKAEQHLRAWFERERDALTKDASCEPGLAEHQVQARSARVVRLAETVACGGARTLLIDLVAQTEMRPSVERPCVAWQLGIDAAYALLRLRDAAALRALGENEQAPSAAAVTVALRGEHDDETVRWIAEHLAVRVEEVLVSLLGRPEQRQLARRWASDVTAPDRRAAAARWLLAHPLESEIAHVDVGWLFTEYEISHSRLYVPAALAHPDTAVQNAAIQLLPRALAELGADATLAELATRFRMSGFATDRRASPDPVLAFWDLEQYLDAVNEHGGLFGSASIRQVIRLIQRHLATAAEGELWHVGRLISLVATAARGLQLAELVAWVRAPGGDTADRAGSARASIITGIFDDSEGPDDDLPSELLQAIVETARGSVAYPAHRILLERASLSVADLLTEWRTISDAMLVDREPTPLRLIAIRGRLQRCAPGEFASALADRLLALPPALRPYGVAEVAQVAMLDPAQAARLSSLFE